MMNLLEYLKENGINTENKCSQCTGPSTLNMIQAVNLGLNDILEKSSFYSHLKDIGYTFNLCKGIEIKDDSITGNLKPFIEAYQKDMSNES